MMRDNPGHFVAHIHANGNVVMMKPASATHTAEVTPLTDAQRRTASKYGSRPLLDGLGVG
jgi:hypothetical protein